MIIKLENEFTLTVIYFARSNPMQICACAWIYRWTKNCGKSGLVTGPSGRGSLGRRPAFSKSRNFLTNFKS